MKNIPSDAIPDREKIPRIPVSSITYNTRASSVLLETKSLQKITPLRKLTTESVLERVMLTFKVPKNQHNNLGASKLT